jgi:stearoyl-CoA desaturase (Delta-9 desaturase)
MAIPTASTTRDPLPAPAAPPAPTAEDIEPCENELRDRIITGTVTVLPILALGVVAWQLWNEALGWSDVIVFLIVYISTGLGITVGFHRLLTHRSFETKPWVRGTLAALGSAAIEGPVTAWVADHRKHHAFSDQYGDPHSPHVEHGHGWKGAFKGLYHAHVGWLFIHNQRGAKARYAPDLLKDPVIAFVDRTFVLWVTLGLLVPFGLGMVIGGSLATGLTGLLWGGLVRMLVLHHATFSINSVCHFFGRQRFRTGDESRNVFWLSLVTFGESWHNNHHAFPTSARHGLRRFDVDPSAWTIWTLEKLGLAWNVVRVSPERQAKKAMPH